MKFVKLEMQNKGVLIKKLTHLSYWSRSQATTSVFEDTSNRDKIASVILSNEFVGRWNISTNPNIVVIHLNVCFRFRCCSCSSHVSYKCIIGFCKRKQNNLSVKMMLWKFGESRQLIYQGRQLLRVLLFL